jgi:hypothetical protein
MKAFESGMWLESLRRIYIKLAFSSLQQRFYICVHAEKYCGPIVVGNWPSRPGSRYQPLPFGDMRICLLEVTAIDLAM